MAAAAEAAEDEVSFEPIEGALGFALTRGDREGLRDALREQPECVNATDGGGKTVAMFGEWGWVGWMRGSYVLLVSAGRRWRSPL